MYFEISADVRTSTLTPRRSRKAWLETGQREQGIAKAILVREGEQVSAGQVLIRMDPVMTGADLKSIQTEVHHKRLALRRIDSQLWREAQSRER
jgi:multidrug efflux pump subunit AcrA (membrane-fusion protein)